MQYVTHKREDGRFQSLKDHSEGVASRAADFARAFHAAEHAERIGKLHDIGKYSANGQRRQIDPEHTPKVDHSTAGAEEAWRLRDPVAAFAIAGHHAGLPDMGTRIAPQEGTLLARVQKELEGKDDPSAWRSEIEVDEAGVYPDMAVRKNPYSTSFYTRMMFSCLVDADFLDTEAFMQSGDGERGGGASIQELNRRMRQEAQKLLDAPNPSAINEMRCDILKRCLDGAHMQRGLYTLTVPTGGGKTKSSLAFALAHAAAQGMSRVIYVIPYTSIIEQNAKVFSDILEEENVLEHHSNVDFSDSVDADDAETRRRMRACENWDAPVVVTTAVQFFESLYASRKSRCRKLHNIADSVIIFDEAQMLPLQYMRPCVAAIAELVQHYGATAVLCTATQPALNDIFREFAPNLRIREICPDTDKLYDFFRRVHFVNDGVQTQEALEETLRQQHQALCIVNARKRARDMYEHLADEGVFHLSTLMTPEDRSRKLDEIRQRLKEGRRCLVISTSLIEAGVDVDFPAVWREVNGLDSVLQAAGRCNRENKCAPEESAVHIFEFSDGTPRMFAQNIAAMKKTASRYEEWNTTAAIRHYYMGLRLIKGNQYLDSRQIVEACMKFQFRTAAEQFRMIDENTITVYIPNDENEALLRRLRFGERGRGLMRQLARSAVNVYPQHYRALEFAMERMDGGYPVESFAILADRSLYSAECGLSMDVETGIAWSI
ncbi:MAG: CRISPR-associated helicase Cas3' [Clostridia bacterium]|nr:CRISPR-associated helicase Cas3' [Clostridia bacterium]